MTARNGGSADLLVVGGGIGGLATALALTRHGFRARVLEQADEFAEIGAGIQLGPNLVRALTHLGVGERVLRDAWLPDNLILRDGHDGSPVTTIPVGEGFRRRFGLPYALMHRADLLAVLREACAAESDIELLTGHRVDGVEDLGDRVVAQLDGGEAHEGRALIGADGLWSRVREALIGDGAPRAAGHIAYRGVLAGEDVPSELWSPDMTVWVGPRTHLVHYPLRRGELFNLVAVFHSDRYSEGYDEAGDRDELWRHFENAHHSVRSLLERIDSWKFWVLCDRDPARGWSRGRVTLLGDAAHPMLQYLAQGAAMAVEDAVCLAAELAAAGGEPEPAFHRYEDRRVLRTARAQLMARVYGEAFHAAGPTRELRDQFLAERSPEGGQESMAWLYDYDSVDEDGAAGARPSADNRVSGPRSPEHA